MFLSEADAIFSCVHSRNVSAGVVGVPGMGVPGVVGCRVVVGVEMGGKGE